MLTLRSTRKQKSPRNGGLFYLYEFWGQAVSLLETILKRLPGLLKMNGASQVKPDKTNNAR